jgi:hypothetical protein
MEQASREMACAGSHRRSKLTLDCSGAVALLELAEVAEMALAGLDDIALVSKAIERAGRHFGVTEEARPFPEGKVGVDTIEARPWKQLTRWKSNRSPD